MATLEQLESRLDSLQESFKQAMVNLVAITEQADKARCNAMLITPYTDTKTAYIGDTEITFYDTPATGNLTVYCPTTYHVDRLTDRIFITFDALEEVTEITISIL